MEQHPACSAPSVAEVSSSSITAATSTSNSGADRPYVAFESWLAENGAVWPKLYLKEYEEDARGCHTRTAIDVDEHIIQIPLRCLITVEMGKDTPVGKAIVESSIDLDVPKHIFLIIFILQDMKSGFDNGFFRPYYDILPKKLSNIPIFWDEDSLSTLRGSYVLEQIKERKKTIQDDYNKICSIYSPFETIATFDEFQWARMIVSSRNFGIVVNGVRTSVLVPLADMLNHSRPRDTRWQFDDSVQAFTVVTIRPISMGEQAFDSYGQKCNHRFLLNYGFSVENNIESDGFCPNEVQIDVSLCDDDGKDSLYDYKLSTWGVSIPTTSCDLAPATRSIRLCVGDNNNTKLLLCMLRIAVADQDDIDEIKTKHPSKFKSIIMLSAAVKQVLSDAGLDFRSIRDAQFPINLKNERKAMTRLKVICEGYLSQYPTKLEEDVENLKNIQLMPMFSNIRNATIQVRGEKEILRFYLSYAEISLSLLDIMESDNSICSSYTNNCCSSSSSSSSSSNETSDISDRFSSSNSSSSSSSSSSSRANLEAIALSLSSNPFMALFIRTQVMQLKSYDMII